jgi:hypothetical protein
MLQVLLARSFIHKIFDAPPVKAPGYDYLRGPQDQVLAQCANSWSALCKAGHASDQRD